MKRVLATSEGKSSRSNKKFAAEAIATGSIKMDSNHASEEEEEEIIMTAVRSSTTTKIKRADSIVLLDSGDEEVGLDMTMGHRKAKRMEFSLIEHFITLKKMFPNITEGLLLERLNQTRNNTNCLQDAVEHFSSLRTDEASNDVLVIEEPETRPTTSASANANNPNANATASTNGGATAAAAAAPVEPNPAEVAFIQSLFPNIDDQLAAEILQNVDNNVNNATAPTTEGRESLILDYIIDNQLNEIATTSNGTPVEDYSLEKDLNNIVSVFEDCDPAYLKDKLKAMTRNPRRVEVIIAELIEKKTYPKLKDSLNSLKKQKEVDTYLNTPLNIDEFLKVFPEPFTRFYNNDKEMSESYKAHCRVELSNRFDFLAEDSIVEVLVKHKYHLTPAYRQLETAVHFKETELKQRAKNNLNSYLKRRNLTLETAPKEYIQQIPKVKFTKNRLSYKLSNVIRDKQPYPDILDTNFFKEMQFIKNENQIKAHILEKDRKRKEKFDDAKKNKTFLECPCCYDDELLDEDVLLCPDGHLFCKDCVKRFAETTIGDGKFVFNCIDEKCKTEFEMSTLSNVLEPNMMSKVLRNIQNEEIKKAGLENLEACQHCTYAAIIENPLDKVFRCLNPECLKETCRLCKEPNHLPLRCSEIEKSDEVNMRTWIENKVTEAMIRECHQCGKRFFKVEGCNMMHCVCGAAMCYLCRVAIPPKIGYKHFSETGCKQYTDVADLHQIEMEKAYKEANELYLKEHPDAANLSLKHDPKKILDELNKEKEIQKQNRLQQQTVNEQQQRVALAQHQQGLQAQIQQLLQQQPVQPINVGGAAINGQQPNAHLQRIQQMHNLIQQAQNQMLQANARVAVMMGQQPDAAAQQLQDVMLNANNVIYQAQIVMGQALPQPNRR